MNIQTVADNLRNTIAGKNELLAEYRRAATVLGRNQAFKSTIAISILFLEINLTELQRILQDVEQCRPEWTPSNCPYAESETCHRID